MIGGDGDNGNDGGIGVAPQWHGSPDSVSYRYRYRCPSYLQ